MLHEFFYWIFNMSITATVTGLLVVILRLIKAIPRRIIKVLWFIPFFRMAVPIGLNSKYSIMSVMSHISTKTITVLESSDEFGYSMMNSVQAAKTYFPVTYKVDIFEGVFKVSSIIWLVVFSVLFIFLFYVYYKMIISFKDARLVNGRVYTSCKIKSPAVYGIIKPRIILPEGYTDDNIELIIEHETTHIRHLDNLIRIIAVIIALVHWFNPFCWIFLKMLFIDIEMSCDECVINKIGERSAKDYAHTLLRSSEYSSVVVSPFGGSNLKKRIENIITFRKITIYSFFVFLTIIIMLFYVTLTNSY